MSSTQPLPHFPERPVICLYILETESLNRRILTLFTSSGSLIVFADLSRTLTDSGAFLHYGLGDATEVLDAIHLEHGIERLLSHEETGNTWSYSRTLVCLIFVNRGDTVDRKLPLTTESLGDLGMRDGWKEREGQENA